MKKKVWKYCTRCDGCGEEPGAPVELDGVWLCSRCNGTGWEPQKRAVRKAGKDSAK